jgi:hypothetical protein
VELTDLGSFIRLWLTVLQTAGRGVRVTDRARSSLELAGGDRGGRSVTLRMPSGDGVHPTTSCVPMPSVSSMSAPGKGRWSTRAPI